MLAALVITVSCLAILIDMKIVEEAGKRGAPPIMWVFLFLHTILAVLALCCAAELYSLSTGAQPWAAADMSSQ